jgi:hypothetical protein
MGPDAYGLAVVVVGGKQGTSVVISCYAVTIFTHQSSQNMMMSYITIRSETEVFVQIKKI